MKCPKCSYERLPTDSAPDWQCPSCKIAYVKALQSGGAAATTPKNQETDLPRTPATQTSKELEERELQERHWLASRGQKIVIYSILLNFILRAVEQSQALPDLAIQALHLCNAAYSLLGVVKICSGLGKTQGRKILFMVMSFFPVVNLVTLVYLSFKTSRMLRDAGWRVGLLGARP
jgi:hypothetical protein